jgi:cobalt-zinc-cadmium efflux system outer membrane protein
MKFSTTFLILLFVSVSRLAYSQDQASGPPPQLLKDAKGRQPMALAQFEQLALAGNPTLAEAGALTKQSAGLARQAGLYPNPVVGYQSEQIRGGAFHGGEQGAFIQQTFVLGGKLGLRRNVYEQQRKANEIGAGEQRQRVLADVRQQFYIALAAQETVNMRQRLLGLANNAVITAKQLANVGQADAPDVLQSEVEAEQAGIDYANAQRTFLQEFRSLATLCGRPELPVAPLAGNLEKPPQIDTARVLDQMIENSPEVKRAQQEIVQAEAEVKSAKRESIPNLEVHAGLQNNFQPIGESATNPVGAQAFVTAGIALPIFNRNQGNVAAAKADAERATLDLKRLQLSLRREAQPEVQGYLAAENQARLYKEEIIPRAERAYQLYLTKYRQMGAAYPQVIVSQRTLFQLQVAYIDVLREVWSHAVALQNFLLTNGLAMPTPSSGMASGVNLPLLGGGGL